jgi:hypothetical protein
MTSQRFSQPTIDENSFNWNNQYMEPREQKLPSINIDELLKNAKMKQKQPSREILAEKFVKRDTTSAYSQERPETTQSDLNAIDNSNPKPVSSDQTEFLKKLQEKYFKKEEPE